MLNNESDRKRKSRNEIGVCNIKNHRINNSGFVCRTISLVLNKPQEFSSLNLPTKNVPGKISHPYISPVDLDCGIFASRFPTPYCLSPTYCV